MPLVTIGTNHKTAPIEIREKLAFKNGQDCEFTKSYLLKSAIAESVVISTCNRTEIYAVIDDDCQPESLLSKICEFHGVPENEVSEHVYCHTSEDAVKHLFEVTSSLDSLVVGEGQINSQVKEAYRLAKKNNFTGPTLNLVFERAFKAAKEVYGTTGIASNKVSISSVGVELVEKVLGSLKDTSVLVIGSGKVGKLSARYFVEKGATKIFAANRTRERSRKLAEEVSGEMVLLEDIDGVLPEVDVVVGCTSARHHVLHRKMCMEIMKHRNNRQLVILDLGVPRNVDPAAGQLPGIHLYNIDQLDEMANANLATRRACISSAMNLIEEEVKETMRQLEAGRRKKTVKELIDRFEKIRIEELERIASKMGDLSDNQKELLEELTNRIVKKVLHQPLTKLRTSGCDKERSMLIDSVQALFEVKTEDAGSS